MQQPHQQQGIIKNFERDEPSKKKPRYRRPKSKQACQRCSQRKVRCDMDSKNYPDEKCTNCEEFNVDCKLVEHKRKRTKTQIAEDRKLAEIQKLGQLTRRNSKVGKSGSIPDENDSPINYNKNHKVLDPYVDLKGDEIILNPDRILNRLVDRYQLSQFVKVLTSHYGLKMSMTDYYNHRGTIKMKDLATDECISILKLSGCFTLPNEENCKEYINAYFVKFQALHPFFTKKQFFDDFGDPYNPKSLLMLRCILYVGCRMMNDSNKLAESKVLYEKARLIANADMEPDGFYLSLSLYILGTPPTLLTSLQTMEDYLNLSIRVANAFGMNKDLSKDDSKSLTKDEKTNYKILFWLLMIKDRVYALSFSKNYNFDRSTCTVEPLVYEDFLNRGLDDPKLTYQMYSHQIEISGLMDKVTNLEKKANIAALAFEPFVHYLNEINIVINEFYDKLEPIHKCSTTSIDSFFVNIYIFSMDLFVQKINIFRLYAVIFRAVKTESASRGLEKEALGITKLEFWGSLAKSVHNLADTIITSALKYKELLPFCQDCVFLIYQGGCGLLPMIYHKDEKIKKSAQEDLKKIIPVLNELSDLISWHMIDACYFILKVIYLDKPKLESYVRAAINAKHDEELYLATKPFPFLNKLLLDNLPPISYPLLQINTENPIEFSDFNQNPIAGWFNNSDCGLASSMTSNPNTIYSDLNVNVKPNQQVVMSPQQHHLFQQYQQHEVSSILHDHNHQQLQLHLHQQQQHQQQQQQLHELQQQQQQQQQQYQPQQQQYQPQQPYQHQYQYHEQDQYLSQHEHEYQDQDQHHQHEQQHTQQHTQQHQHQHQHQQLEAELQQQIPFQQNHLQNHHVLQQQPQPQPQPVVEKFLNDYFSPNLMPDPSNLKALTELEDIYITQFKTSKGFDSFINEINTDPSQYYNNFWDDGYKSTEALSHTNNSIPMSMSSILTSHSDPNLAPENNISNIEEFESTQVEAIDSFWKNFQPELFPGFHPPMVMNPEVCHPPLVLDNLESEISSSSTEQFFK